MRIVIALFLTVFSLGMLAAPAYAKTCFTRAEAEAEQGIRIHSELMVIGLNCQAMRMRGGAPNLYAQYREFTNHHANIFADYETKLMEYYRRTGVNNPEAALNTMRTAFANKISLDSAKMRPDLFCNRYAERLTRVRNMDAATLRKWASTFYASHPLSQPLCQQ